MNLKPTYKDNTGCTPISVGAMNQRPRPTPGARVNKGELQGGTAVGDATNLSPIPPAGMTLESMGKGKGD